MGDVNKRNFAALEQGMNKLARDNSTLNQRMTVLENNLSILHSELANQKQLVGHVLGRGMGSTVKEEPID